MAQVDKKREENRILSEKIKQSKVAMLTTVDEDDGILRSRPMITQKMDCDGELWFLTQASASKVGEAQNHQVNLSYALPAENCYVSVSGVAHLVRDRQKVEQFWQPLHTTWFQGGKDDPDLALLKVTVTSAEYWDGPANKMVQIFQTARSLSTDRQMETHEKLQMR